MKKTVKNLITWSPSHLITSPKSAFTLAEVLITLAIIGVVAAMTIPTLISNYKERQTITKLQKVYSTLKNAFDLARVDHGDFSTWSWQHIQDIDTNRTDYFWNTYGFPYLKVSKICSPISEDCFPTNDAKNTNGNSLYYHRSLSAFILNDGTMIETWAGGDAFAPHIWLVADLNGHKGPNIVGNDIFHLYFTINALANPYSDINENGEYTNTKDFKHKNGLSLYGDVGFSAKELLDENKRLNDENGNTYNASCSKTGLGRFCGAVIKLNNWRIPDDYPIKF